MVRVRERERKGERLKNSAPAYLMTIIHVTNICVHERKKCDIARLKSATRTNYYYLRNP